MSNKKRVYEVNVPAIYLNLDDILFESEAMPILIVKTIEGDKYHITIKEALRLREIIDLINDEKREQFIKDINSSVGFEYIFKLLKPEEILNELVK
jgi:hypothetical protein